MKKVSVLQIRLSSEDMGYVEESAHAAGKKVSAWAREKLLNRAGINGTGQRPVESDLLGNQVDHTNLSRPALPNCPLCNGRGWDLIKFQKVDCKRCGGSGKI